jgi:hypothetical protein
MSVMFAVHGRGKRPPTLVEAAAELRIPVEQLDGVYGVQLVNPWDHIYAVRSRDESLSRHRLAHSDPPIGIFGDW